MWKIVKFRDYFSEEEIEPIVIVRQNDFDSNSRTTAEDQIKWYNEFFHRTEYE